MSDYSVFKTADELHNLAATKAIEAMQMAVLYPSPLQTPLQAYRRTYENWINHYDGVASQEMFSINNRTWKQWFSEKIFGA